MDTETLVYLGLGIGAAYLLKRGDITIPGISIPGITPTPVPLPAPIPVPVPAGQVAGPTPAQVAASTAAIAQQAVQAAQTAQDKAVAAGTLASQSPVTPDTLNNLIAFYAAAQAASNAASLARQNQVNAANYLIAHPGLTGLQKHIDLGLLEMAIKATDINDSDKAISDTLGLMASHANKAVNTKQIQDAVKACGCNEIGLDDDAKLKRIFDYIKVNVKFVEDADQLGELTFKNSISKELLITPPALLSMKQSKGDCDDFSMLGAAMLLACGFQVAFKTVAADQRYPDEFTHVYLLVTKKGGSTVPFDSSHGSRVGWETDKRYREMIWPIVNWEKGIGMIGDLDEFGNVMGTGIPGVSTSLTSNSFNWGSVIPGLFNAGEKIGIQLTQQAGYQTTGPNGVSTSYVLPGGSNASALSIPGLTTGSIGSSTLLIGAAIIGAILLFSHK